MLAVTVHDDDGKTPIDWRLCLVPKSDYEIIDTWYAMGMAATGSKDIAVNELFVPERRALALALCRGGGEHPGAALNPGPLFRIPIVAASSHPLAPAALGAAEGAYELFLESMAKRMGTYTGARVADFQAVQIKVARARCLIDSARDLLRRSAIEFQAAAQRNEAPDLDTKLRIPGALGVCGEPGARGGGDAVVVLRRAGPLHPRSAAAAPARRARHQPALLVQLRHRRGGVRVAGARRQVRQSDNVSRRLYRRAKSTAAPDGRAVPNMRKFPITFSTAVQSSGAPPPMKDTATKPRVEVKTKTKRPPLHKVILVNDDYTPREFVVTVLMGEFRMSEDQAYRVMITAHRRGVCVVAVYAKDIAETKATRGTEAGRRKGYPLLFTTEPEE